MTIEDKALIEGLSDSTKALIYYSTIGLITEVRRTQQAMRSPFGIDLQQDPCSGKLGDFYSAIVHEANQVAEEIKERITDKTQLSLVKHFAPID